MGVRMGRYRDKLCNRFSGGRMLDSDGYSSDWTYRDRLHKDLRHGAVAGLLGGASIMILCTGGIGSVALGAW